VTMVLEDLRRAAHLQRESEALRNGLDELRSVVDRMSRVLDRMEQEQQEPKEGPPECPTT